MRGIMFGASGMVGSGVLEECLASPDVASILVVGRSSCGLQHEKLTEIIHRDFFDYSEIRDRLAGYDACFFCLGVSSAGMSEEEYHRLTYDLSRLCDDDREAGAGDDSRRKPRLFETGARDPGHQRAG